MDRNNKNVNGKWSMGRGRLVTGLGVFVAVTAVSSVAKADIWTMLFGANENGVVISKVLEPGEIVFNTASPEYDDGMVMTGPKVHFASRCKRDGFRCQKVVGFTTASLSVKQSEDEGDVEANLIAKAYGHDAAKNKADVIKALQNACKTKQTTVRLPVAVRLTCKRVKWNPIGDQSFEKASDSMIATYKLTCN